MKKGRSYSHAKRAIGLRIEALRPIGPGQQSRLAEAIGISMATISDIINGQIHPSARTLIKIKKAFPKADLNFILMGE